MINALDARIVTIATTLRRTMHAYPEIGLDLPHTQKALTDLLDQHGIDYTLGKGLTSVVVDMQGLAPGPKLLLRADMDALPIQEPKGLAFASTRDGFMHACGHDMHTAILLGTLLHLHQKPQAFSGSIRFMFQPGEEGYNGAGIMIEEGVLKQVDAAFGLHMSPTERLGVVQGKPGALMAGSYAFQIDIQGKGGHSAMPEHAINPVLAAAHITSHLQSLPSVLDAHQPIVVTTTNLHAGDALNVIPETAFLAGTVRFLDTRYFMDTVKKRMEAIISHVAQAHGCSARLTSPTLYNVTRNHDVFYANVVEPVLGKDRYRRLDLPIMGSEDFSAVLEKVPGSYVFLGACPNTHNPEKAASLHHPAVCFDEKAIEYGIELFLKVVQRYFATNTGESP